MSIKRCSKCKADKDISGFYKNRCNRDGLNYWCKDCVNDSQIGRVRNLEKQLYWQRSAYKRNCREWIPVLDELGITPVCQICDKKLEWFNGRLRSAHFDHRNGYPAEYDKNKDTPSLWFASNLPTNENIEAFRKMNYGILCHSCNLRIPTDTRYREKLARYLT